MKGINLNFLFLIFILPYLCLITRLYSSKQENTLFLTEASTNNFTLQVKEIFELDITKNLKANKFKKTTKIGLKVYTNSGAGICTPTHLTKDIINQLIEIGYLHENIFITDLDRNKLRECEYLPSLSNPELFFHGVRVIPLLDSNTLDTSWSYESPLPQNEKMNHEIHLESSFLFRAGLELDRRSLLPAPLILDTDFWINLPIFTDHYSLGLNGALLNGTLWNISNNDRFFLNPNSGNIGIAEIASIPELKDKWILNIGSLIRLQYIGGPEFNSLYNTDLNKLIVSTNPLCIDHYVLKLMNKNRIQNGFLPFEVPPYFKFAKNLGYKFESRDLVIKKF